MTWSVHDPYGLKTPLATISQQENEVFTALTTES